MARSSSRCALALVAVARMAHAPPGRVTTGAGGLSGDAEAAVSAAFFLFVVGPLGPPRLSLALLRSSLLASARFLLSKTDCYVMSGSGFGERAQTENRDVRATPGSGL